MPDYWTDREWADAYNDYIGGLVARHLGEIVQVIPADRYRDIHFACDFVLSDEVAVSSRVRRPPACNWALTWDFRERNRCPRKCVYGGRPAPWVCNPRDITIRSWRRGVPTELQKMQAGHTRWLFYGWAERGHA